MKSMPPSPEGEFATDLPPSPEGGPETVFYF